jgi:hypothetical protein
MSKLMDEAHAELEELHLQIKTINEVRRKNRPAAPDDLTCVVAALVSTVKKLAYVIDERRP